MMQASKKSILLESGEIKAGDTQLCLVSPHWLSSSTSPIIQYLCGLGQVT